MKLRETLVFFLAFLAFPACLPLADSPWLYGIHWYGDTGSSDVEDMSEGKGIYVLEQVFTDTATEGNFWEEPAYKVTPWSQITAKGHTLIARLHPNWGRAVPKPTDSYTVADFVADCAGAAETLKNVCHIWQLSNEMNILGEYGGEQLAPSYYVSVYKQVKSSIESVSSPLGPQIVLLGPVSPGGVIPGVRWMDGNQYLQQMLDELAPGEVGGFGVHSYGGGTLSAALADFRNGLTGQLALIDNAGFTDLPVYITEWNRHTPSAGEEPTSAHFLYHAFDWLHDWNTTPGSHNIVGACWFVYPAGVGWDDYSIAYHKTPTGNQDNDLWKAFEYSAAQDYPAGIFGGGGDPGINGESFFDDFEDGVIDRFGPLPDWMVLDSGGGSTTESEGSLIFRGNSINYSSGSVITQGYLFDDFICETRVTFTDTTPLHPASPQQANTEVRFRMRDQGYSLTLDAAQDYIRLRRANVWTVIGGYEQPVTINNGDAFNIRISAGGDRLSIQVGRAPGSDSDVVNWSVTNSEYASGMFQLSSYAIEEVRYDFFQVTVNSGLQGWQSF